MSRRESMLKSYVTEREKEVVERLAAENGISVSEVIRQLIVNGAAPDPADLEAVVKLGRANADLARLGNLLRLAINADKLDKANKIRASDLIFEIRMGQGEIRKAVQEVRTGSKARRARRQAIAIRPRQARSEDEGRQP